jgi:enoyl-CoA hydratase
LKKATITAERVREGVALVTYVKAPVNAAAAEDHLEIARVFRELPEDRDLRAIVFTAAGERAFISGADLEAKATESERLAALSPRYQVDPGLPAREAFEAVAACPVPVIGALNGPAIGGGLAYAACCDVLLAVERTFFQIGEINVGLLGAVSQLRSLVGSFEARRMYFTGVRVPASELAASGAVHRVLPDRESLLAAALDLAGEIATKSPIAVRLAKEVFIRAEVEPMLDSYRQEQAFTARLQTFADSAEAMAAFLEKRDPEWKWR